MEMSNSNKKFALCRTCLDSISKDNVINIFDTLDLAEKLQLCSGQPVEAYDEYPENVCQYCYEQIILFYDFQQMCCKSLVKFKKLIKVKETQLEENVKICLQIKTLPKNPLNATFNNLTEKAIMPSDNRDVLKEKKKRGRLLKENTEDLKLERTNVIKERIRNEDFSAGRDIGSEELMEYNELENEIVNIKTEDSETEEIYNDIETQPTPIEDVYISDTIKSEDISEHQIPSYSDHDFTYSQNLKRYQCDRCSNSFHTPDRLEAHARQQHNLPPYACTLEGCERIFKRWSFYIKHLKEHKLLQDQGFRCDLDNCERVYKNRSGLNLHKRKFHNFGPELKKHMCEICGKIFKLAAALNEHRYTHVDKTQLPYACEVEGCAKRFANKERLKIHKMRHDGIKNFKCPYCGVYKTTRSELKTHINYHTLEKTWPCRFCPKVCNNSKNLHVHIKNMHEGVKDFACRFCERTFAKAETKKFHEMTHTGEKPHECEECGRRFLQPGTLKTHRKVHLREKVKVGRKRKRKAVVEKEEKQHISQDTEPEPLPKESVVVEILCDVVEILD